MHTAIAQIAEIRQMLTMTETAIELKLANRRMNMDPISAMAMKAAEMMMDIADRLEGIKPITSMKGIPTTDVRGRAWRPVPAVPVEQSVHDDRIVCLEDGTEHIMMKRYLRTEFGLSPQQYRQRWGLPIDYPMVAPAYAEKKRAEALANGLGHIVGHGNRISSKNLEALIAKRIAAMPSTQGAVSMTKKQLDEQKAEAARKRGLVKARGKRRMTKQGTARTGTTQRVTA